MKPVITALCLLLVFTPAFAGVAPLVPESIPYELYLAERLQYARAQVADTRETVTAKVPDVVLVTFLVYSSVLSSKDARKSPASNAE